MIKRSVLLAFLALLTSAAPGSADASSRIHPVLIAAPSGGHGNDLLFLSGNGYRPHTRLTVVMGCPGALWTSARDKPSAATQSKLVVGGAGPRTDAHGRFVRFAFHAPTLPKNVSMTCHLYMTSGGNPPEPGANAPYTIFSDTETLPLCDAKICLSVEPKRRGSNLLLSIHGWPGARLNGWVVYYNGNAVGQSSLAPRATPVARATRCLRPTLSCAARLSASATHYRVDLGWRGLTVVRPVRQATAGPMPRDVRLTMTARLGNASGQYVGKVYQSSNGWAARECQGSTRPQPNAQLDLLHILGSRC